MQTTNAYIDDINPQNISVSHDVDPDRVNSIAAAIEQGQDIPRPLVVNGADGAIILDGHHRIAAYAQLGVECESYVIDFVDYEALLIDHFQGDLPSRLADLDNHILVDGAPYDRD